MMKLVCCTEDILLAARCRDLYGSSALVRIENLDVLKGENPAEANSVVIVDLKFYQLDELEGITLPLVALTEMPSFQEAVQLLQRGVRGYGNRIGRKENLEQAVTSVATGQIWLPPDIILRLIETVGNNSFFPKNPFESTESERLLGMLSRREQEVAQCVADGMSNKEISEQLFVSLRTVKAHLSSIYDKTGLRNRLELGITMKGTTR